jgi:hypothetical protein
MRRRKKIPLRRCDDLFDHLVGEREHFVGNGKAERLRVFRLITNSNRVDCSTGRSAGLAPLRIFPV